MCLQRLLAIESHFPALQAKKTLSVIYLCSNKMCCSEPVKVCFILKTYYCVIIGIFMMIISLKFHFISCGLTVNDGSSQYRILLMAVVIALSGEQH